MEVKENFSYVSKCRGNKIPKYKFSVIIELWLTETEVMNGWYGIRWNAEKPRPQVTWDHLFCCPRSLVTMQKSANQQYDQVIKVDRNSMGTGQYHLLLIRFLRKAQSKLCFRSGRPDPCLLTGRQTLTESCTIEMYASYS